MPETAERTSPTVLPKLTISKPSEDVAGTSRKSFSAGPRIESGSRRDSKEQGRSSLEWVDVDESPPRRRKSGKRSSQRHSRSSRSVSGSDPSSKVETKPSRFLPRLTQILEGKESGVSSNYSSQGSGRRRHHDPSSAKRSHYRGDSSSIHRPSTRARSDIATKKSVKFLNANPSLLSVLSTFTANSDRSSHSSSTVTQQSYDRETITPSRESSNISRRRSSQQSSNMSSKTASPAPNPFDYMDGSAVDDIDDKQSVASSQASSKYAPSDHGSSHTPDTPSSRSTFPSPTTTRSQLVPEVRKRYDPQYASSTRSNSTSPDPSLRSLHHRPSISDVPEEDEHDAVSSGVEPAQSRRTSSRSSIGSRRRSVQLHQQEESLRQHIAYSQQSHYVDPIYGQRRSFSNSSVHSDRSNYGYHMAMQQYQWPPQHPAGAPPTPPHAVNGQSSPGVMTAPEPPDLTRRTLTGYEELALELSTTESPVRPLYRKFEYLNHRIMLHLQDELCELEEQLRHLDEIIAQMDAGLADGQRTPASRRNDAFRGTDLHQRRTHLLGNIFMKTEQYNRAMSSYASIAKDSVAAEDDQVASYQEWMNKRAPIQEVETRFLLHHQDLILPGKKQMTLDRPTKHAALAYLPVALMLPLLLYSIIPTLAGRLAVTALIAIGAFVVAATTRIRQLMQARDWAICGGLYVLLMAGIAGCIPTHT